MLQSVLLSIPQGIILGGAYGAIALGLSVIFGVTRVINFAHGSMLMVSTFAYYALYQLLGIDPYLGILIVTPVMFIVGYFLRRSS
jgi:branched-chain amino acid transport system permease protein